jgi:chromate transporter
MNAPSKGGLWQQLLGVFAPLSLLSIGGGQAILGDLQKQVVIDHHWLTVDRFLDDFAISRAAPGPNTLIVTLIGWQVDGVVGAVVTSLAIFLPSSVLFYGLTLVWRWRALGAWPNRLARGLAPVSVGLALGSAYSVLASNGGDPLTWIVAGACLLALLLTKVHPFVLLGGGAAAFLVRGAISP